MSATTTLHASELRELVRYMRDENISNVDRIDGTLDRYDEERLTAAWLYLRDVGGDIGPYWEDDTYKGAWTDLADWAQQLCEDIGDVPASLPGYVAVDWSATADNLLADYTTVEHEGVTYLFRD